MNRRALKTQLQTLLFAKGAAALNRGKDIIAIHSWVVIRRVVRIEGRTLRVRYVGRETLASAIDVFGGTWGDPSLQDRVERGNSLTFFYERLRPRDKDDVDVTLIDPLLLSKRHDHGIYRYVPFLTATLPVAPSATAQLAVLHSKAYRRKMRAAQRRPVRWRLSKSSEDFTHFYHELYVPFAQSRFAEQAFLLSEAQMRQRLERKGALLLLETEWGPCGAMVYRPTSKPQTLAFFKYGGQTEVSMRVKTAQTLLTEIAVLEYARQIGARELDMGISRPLATDGIFIHKRRLGCDFRQLDGMPKVALWVAPHIRHSFFARRPLVVSCGGELCLQLGYGTEDAYCRSVAQVTSTIKDARFPSLRNIAVSTDASASVLPSLRAAWEPLSTASCRVVVDSDR